MKEGSWQNDNQVIPKRAPQEAVHLVETSTKNKEENRSPDERLLRNVADGKPGCTWVKALGQQLASSYPDLIALAPGAMHRGGRVTIDDAQNSLGRNTAAPYTLRAHVEGL